MWERVCLKQSLPLTTGDLNTLLLHFPQPPGLVFIRNTHFLPPPLPSPTSDFSFFHPRN